MDSFQCDPHRFWSYVFRDIVIVNHHHRFIAEDNGKSIKSIRVIHYLRYSLGIEILS